MKYGSLKSDTEKSFCIPAPDKGVKLSDRSADSGGGSLSFCRNVLFKDGRLVSRPGICANTESTIGGNIYEGADSVSYSLTDTSCIFGGEDMRIATATAYYSDSNCLVYVYLVADSGDVTEIGYMYFGRVSGDIFYTPSNVTFYVGAKQNGGGIFAMVSLVNTENPSQKDYRIYEVTSDFTEWESCTDYYTPTVYVNGRGNSYEFAKQSGSVCTAAPLYPEALNLLDGRFYAYYTSDGYSSGFRLPFSSLSDSSVICRIYKSSENYCEWLVPEGANSAAASFNGVNVTMTVDRNKGIVNFLASGSNYAIPQMYAYAENNIRISAKKDISEQFGYVVSSRLSVPFDSVTVFSGGVRASNIYYTTYDNPLYFPAVWDNTVGEPESGVTALKRFKNRIIAFKKNGIYSVEVNGVKAFNKISLIADNPSVFYETGSYRIKCISNSAGCSLTASAASSPAGLIWLSDDRSVYSIVNDSVHLLSSGIKPYLEGIETEKLQNAAAVAADNYYLLFFGSKAVIMQYGSKGLSGDLQDISWYIWDFPQEYSITGAFTHGRDPVLICEYEDIRQCVTAVLGGAEDITPMYTDGALTEKHYAVESVIEMKSALDVPIGKTALISRIYMELAAANDTDILLESGRYVRKLQLYKTDIADISSGIVKLIVNMKCKDMMSITLKSYGKISLGKSEIYYSQTDN